MQEGARVVRTEGCLIYSRESETRTFKGCFGFGKTEKINRILRKIFSQFLSSVQDSGEIR